MGLLTKRNWMLPAVVALTLTGGPGYAAPADPIPYSATGKVNPTSYRFIAAATGSVMGYFAGSGAGYDEQVGMLVNGVQTSAGFGLDDHTSSLGTMFNFGDVTAGDTLVFVLDVFMPSLGMVYSDASLNAAYDGDGVEVHNHVYSAAYTAASALLPGVPFGTYVSFEDQRFPYSDFNYTDETFVVSNVVCSTSIAEPSSLIVLFAGLLAIPYLLRSRIS